MPGTNAGTGQRLHARCWRCARGGDRYRGYHLTYAGKARMRRKSGKVGVRMDPTFEFKVKCRDCGYEGWTGHIDIARRFYAVLARNTQKTIKELGLLVW